MYLTDTILILFILILDKFQIYELYLTDTFPDPSVPTVFIHSPTHNRLVHRAQRGPKSKARFRCADEVRSSVRSFSPTIAMPDSHRSTDRQLYTHNLQKYIARTYVGLYVRWLLGDICAAHRVRCQRQMA